MARLRRQHQSAAPYVQASAAVLAVVVWLFSTEDQAFVGIGRPSINVPSATIPQAMPAGMTGQLQSAVSGRTQRTMLSAAASVALLFLAAGRCRSTCRTSKVRHVRCQAVMSHPTITQVVPVSPQKVEIEAAPACLDIPLLDLDTPVSVGFVMAAVPSVARESSECSATSQLPRASRFVGGARRAVPGARGRSSAHKSARRAVGSRLCERAEAQVYPCAYDASLIRMKIQRIINAASSPRCARGRDSKCQTTIQVAATRRGWVLIESQVMSVLLQGHKLQ